MRARRKNRQGLVDVFYNIKSVARRYVNTTDPLPSRSVCRRRLLEHLEDRGLLAAITGTAFYNLDQSGSRDVGEQGLPGWTVCLDQDYDGNFDFTASSDVSDGFGNYSFTRLAVGRYNVVRIPPAGWTPTNAIGSSVATTAKRSNSGSGDDLIYGGNQNDDIDGGTGNDEIFGQNGNDTIDAGNRTNTVNGGAGDDWGIEP